MTSNDKQICNNHFDAPIVLIDMGASLTRPQSNTDAEPDQTEQTSSKLRKSLSLSRSLSTSLSQRLSSTPRSVLSLSKKRLNDPGSALTEAKFKDWNVVGQGAHGEVFSAVSEETGEVVAVKMIPRRLVDDYVCSRYASMARCRHSNIIACKQVSASS